MKRTKRKEGERLKKIIKEGDNKRDGARANGKTTKRERTTRIIKRKTRTDEIRRNGRKTQKKETGKGTKENRSKLPVALTKLV